MSYDVDNVFARILRGEIPSERVYEDQEFVAFHDISPVAQTHILVIPRAQMLGSPAELSKDDVEWVGRMVLVAVSIAEEHGLNKSGYRLVMNSGSDAGQAVAHIHMHLVGGAELGPIA